MTTQPGEGGPARAVTEVRVVLPAHVRSLAGVEGEVRVDVTGEPTATALMDALEARYPTIRGTVRTHDGRRRDFIRYFACGEDISHDSPDLPLPDDIIEGREVFQVVGAIAGG